LDENIFALQVLTGLIGNPVKCRSGPAAVTGDETTTATGINNREGVGSRMSRKPEDLPGNDSN